MKEIELKERNKDHAAYAEAMAKELKGTYKRPVSTVQCASTAAALSRDLKDDEAHFFRSLDVDACKGVTVRDVTPYDEANEAAMLIARQAPKNEIGQSLGSSTSYEKREAAANALIYTEGVPFPFKEEANKPSYLEEFVNFFKGRLSRASDEEMNEMQIKVNKAIRERR